jgi:hypothetical protein
MGCTVTTVSWYAVGSGLYSGIGRQLGVEWVDKLGWTRYKIRGRILNDAVHIGGRWNPIKTVIWMLWKTKKPEWNPGRTQLSSGWWGNYSR